MNADPGPHPALTGAAMVEAAGYALRLTESVLLVYDPSVLSRRWYRRRRADRTHPFREVVFLDAGIDAVVALGPGAPVTAITVELLVALGARRIVSIGSAGILNAHQAAPRTVVADRAESDEGTSSHYGGDLRADEALVELLCDSIGLGTATVLSTDVPFRHDAARLESHRRRADFVDMECAALFAAARHLGVEAASVLVGSDTFAPTGWRALDPAATTTRLRELVVDVSSALAAAP